MKWNEIIWFAIIFQQQIRMSAGIFCPFFNLDFGTLKFIIKSNQLPKVTFDHYFSYLGHTIFDNKGVKKQKEMKSEKRSE